MSATITTLYAVQTRAGSENKIAQRILAAAKKYASEIVQAVPIPKTGYVTVKVVAGKNAKIQSAVYELPKNAQMVIEMVPGVIRIAGNGKEPVPFEVRSEDIA